MYQINTLYTLNTHCFIYIFIYICMYIHIYTHIHIHMSTISQLKNKVCSMQQRELVVFSVRDDVWQKPTQFCKAIILQLKNK